jgi:hypothetical protein
MQQKPSSFSFFGILLIGLLNSCGLNQDQDNSDDSKQVPTTSPNLPQLGPKPNPPMPEIDETVQKIKALLEQQKINEEFKGISDEEILKKKYKKALFCCEYKTSLKITASTGSGSASKQVSDSREISWDLLSDFTASKEFAITLDSNPGLYIANLKININKVHVIPSLGTKLANGESYNLLYTPEIDLSYTKHVAFTHAPKILITISDYQQHKAVGEVQALEDKIENGVADKELYSDYLHCWLDLDMNQRYQHQKEKLASSPVKK